MTDRTPDPERMAALLDGRLDARARQELVDALAGADADDLSAFADAAAVQKALEDEDRADAAATDEGVIPISSHRRFGGWSARRWAALAAAVAAVALAPLLWNRFRAPDLADPAHVVALLDAQAEGLPVWWDERSWSSTRGAGDPLTRESRSARLGMFLVDLEMAARAGDADAVAVLAARVAALLDEVPAAGPAAATYREAVRRAAAGPDALHPLLAEGADAVRPLVDEPMLALGAWAEAARFAAARQDAGFFATRASRTALARAPAAVDAEGRAALEQVRAALADAGDEGGVDWEGVQVGLAALLAAVGR